MNLITAEFNLISFALLVVAGIIGILRSARKSDSSRQPPFPEFIPQEEEETEEYAETETWESVEKQEVFEEFPTDGHVCQNTALGKETYLTPKGEEEEQPAVSFDIRQAVISSEILRRPDF